MLISDIRIHWPAINAANMEASQKHDYSGLQVADCVASSVRWALEYTRYGHTEHRYVKNIKKIVYSRKKQYTSYGMKFFPHGPDPSGSISHWIHKYYK
jgi:hypothetical protein